MNTVSGKTCVCVPEPIIEYINSNIVLLKNMIARGYQDARSIAWRIRKMEECLADPQPLEADAEYAAVIEIDLNDIVEPIVCCPNDPDDAKIPSDVAGAKIDEAWSQLASATPDENFAISSPGLLRVFSTSSVSLGRPLRRRAISSSSVWLAVDRSLPMGRNWRSRPLVFSLLPRCHGACGSQNRMAIFNHRLSLYRLRLSRGLREKGG